MADNRAFYNEILIDHNMHPAHKHELPDADLEMRGYNPTCGDDITLRLKVADGVNIRAGNHCAQPLLDHLGTGATARMSLAFYNTVADVERFLASLKTMRERMGYGR